MARIYPLLLVAALFLSFSIGKYSSNDRKLVVEHQKLNALYIDLPNPLLVSAEGVAPEDLELQISNGEISGESGQYNVEVRVPGPSTIEFYENRGKGKKTFLGTREYMVKPMPYSYAQIMGIGLPAGYSRTGFQNAYLSEGRELFGVVNALVKTDMDYDWPAYIVRFDMQTVVDGDTIVHRSDDNFLSLQMLEELNRSNHDQEFIFKEILAEYPDKSTKWLRDVKINIVRIRPETIGPRKLHLIGDPVTKDSQK